MALSNVTIFAGAITNMLFNVPRKHPFKAGPIIDYDLLLLVRHTVGYSRADSRGQQPATDSRSRLPARNTPDLAEVTINAKLKGALTGLVAVQQAPSWQDGRSAAVACMSNTCLMQITAAASNYMVCVLAQHQAATL